MFLCPVAALKMSNTIFLPSGDHLGSKQLFEVGSETAPPQEGWVWTWISRRPVPSAWTTQSEIRTSGVTRCEKTISFPCGDQSPVDLKSVPVGVICLTPVLLTLATKRPTGSPFWSERPKTRCLPL